MLNLKPCKKGNTRLMKLVGGLSYKKIQRYNNSPPYVTARWQPQQIASLNFLGPSVSSVYDFKLAVMSIQSPECCACLNGKSPLHMDVFALLNRGFSRRGTHPVRTSSRRHYGFFCVWRGIGKDRKNQQNML